MVYAIATHLELPDAILMLVHCLLPNKRAQIPQVQIQGETHPRSQLCMIPNIIAWTSVGVNQDAGNRWVKLRLEIELLYSRQRATIDGEKRKEGSRLMWSEHIDLKLGDRVRPIWRFPEFIDAQLGELPPDPLVQAAGVLYLVLCVVNYEDISQSELCRRRSHHGNQSRSGHSHWQLQVEWEQGRYRKRARDRPREGCEGTFHQRCARRQGARRWHKLQVGRGNASSTG